MASAFSLFGELKLDRTNFTSGLAAADRQLDGFKSTLQSVERAASRAFENIGSMMQSVGKGLTAGLSAPLLAIEGAAVKSAVGFDTMRTQLAAATGSTAAASDKFKELNKLAQENAGVLTAGAVATYNFLKPLGLADGTINETIKAFGKLKASNPEVDLQRMATNLGQLFDQGFEQQDLKELLGNFPRALEIMKKAFGLKSSDRKGIAEEMKGLIASGKLTKQDFFGLFAAGINTDEFLSKVTDPVAIRFEKMKERIFLALEPLGNLILANLERWAPYIVAFVEKISTAFTALSPAMQMIVTAFSALAIAAGPVLWALGGIVTAIGGMVASAGVIGVVAAVLVGLGAAMVPVIAIAGFFYQAWVDNWDLVKAVFNDGVAFVTSTVTTGLTALQGFWAEHGAAIMDYLTSWWNTLSTVITEGMNIVSTVMQTILYALQGEWGAVWEGILNITTQVWGLITTAVGNAMGVVGNLLKAWGPIFVQGVVWAFTQVLSVAAAGAKALVDIFFNLPQILISMIPRLIAAGSQIGAAIQTGIANGIRNFLNPQAVADIGGGVGPSPFQSFVDSFKNLFAGSGPKAGLEGGLGGFLAPATTQANTLSAALDKVTAKAKQAKAVIAPKIAAKTAKAVAAAGKTVYGKAVTLAPGGILMDLTPLTPGVGTAYQHSTTSATNEILQGLTDAVKEGKLAIEIIDPNRSTTLGGTSNNVNARYR